jgi:uncharacterized protein YbcI
MNPSQPTMAQQIAQAAITFEQQRTGNHLPKSVTVVLCENTLLITLHEALLPAEMALAQSPAGAAQVQEFYRQLFRTGSEAMRQEIKRITGLAVLEAAPMVQAFMTGTVVQVFLLDGNVPTEIWTGSPSGATPSP